MSRRQKSPAHPFQRPSLVADAPARLVSDSVVEPVLAVQLIRNHVVLRDVVVLEDQAGAVGAEGGVRGKALPLQSALNRRT